MRYQARYKKGDRIGGSYLVHQVLMGGMGEVYLCLDEENNYPYALKTFQGSDLRMRELFETEVASWIALEKHPNIVRLFYTQTLDNIPFMLLEWIASSKSKGSDLRSWLRNGALELDLALKFAIDIVRGLQHANDKSPGIVHRDLKPDNVLVNQSRQAKITDFGLATVVQEANLDIQTSETGEASMRHSIRVGNVVGTPAYMPPEQWRGELKLDFRTDIYAVGCIFYEMLTGEMLYNGRTIRKLKSQHLEAQLPALNGDFLPEMKQILEGCLAKEPDKRFASLELLMADLTKAYETETGESLAKIDIEAFTAIDYNNRGSTYGNLGQHQRAIEDFDEAMRLDPTDALTHYNRGIIFNKLEQTQQALRANTEAIHLNPLYADAYHNRGVCYEKLGHYEQALQNYDEGIRLDPSDSHAYYNRGVAYSRLGQYEWAIKNFDEALRLDPEYADAYHNRGVCYTQMRQFGRALQDYDEALRLDPINPQLYMNKARALVKVGQLEDAIKVGEKAAHYGAPRADDLVAQVRQMLGQASTRSPVNEQESALGQLFEIYRQHGEAGLRQVLEQSNVPTQQIEQIIAKIKQIIGGA